MDKPRCLLLHDMAKVRAKQPFKDELKQRYHIYEDLTDYFNTKSKKKCDILPVCGSCGSENTHRLTYTMTVNQNKWWIETEIYCIDCDKYTNYDFKEPNHDFTPRGVQKAPFIGQIHPMAKQMLPIVDKKLQRWRDRFGPDYEWPSYDMIEIDGEDGSFEEIETTQEEMASRIAAHQGTVDDQQKEMMREMRENQMTGKETVLATPG